MIRKQNSSFKTAFISEAGNNIKNSDCFAYVELDGFACYVLANAIDNDDSDDSARLCVDSVISAFTESPSISKRALKKYINAANEALLNAKKRKKLKASVIILIHNYAKMRYAQAGNARFRLYRDGFLKYESLDQSLAQDLVKSDDIPKNMMEKHEERHNLYTYIGQKEDFYPHISKKIKLTNTDSIALYTKGFWENIDDGEVLDIFKDAGTEPQELVDTAEDMLLSKQPENLGSYSFVTIMVEKIFIDPNFRRRIKRIIMITIAVLVVVAIIATILWVRHNKKQEKIELMNDNYKQTIEYIKSDNYIKAETTANKTIDLANELKNKEKKDETTNYLMMIESIIKGDDELKGKNYDTAQNHYLTALDKSRYADKISDDYIENKLKLTANYMSVYDLTTLGDNLVTNMQYEEAEKKYIEAKNLASKIYFDEGRQSAIKALENLYELQKEDAEKKQKETDDKMQKEASSSNFMAEGDKAFGEGDYETALVNYVSAKQKYTELEDTANIEMTNNKIALTQSKLEENKGSIKEAQDYVKKAEEAKKSGDLINSTKLYLLAKDIYGKLKDYKKVAAIQIEIDTINMEIEKNNAQMQKENSEVKNDFDEDSPQPEDKK
ncbi:hypothetical protein FL857_03590 [Criibacterium bergeronii]|uniref:Serine/threonine protein phosphatase n=1 Tax=Criibacterium bergeronii TaxID=1871336 RepID=A0A552VC96_9FIRM|nr:PP2C family serine/threonine-protein phosphatase [Criibacterium bergeronii]TRW28087.1 hypothetical protein FL857_03590 [Criibacterium bergeronii]